MIMSSKEYIRRTKLREKHEKEVEDKRIDKLVLKRIRKNNKHLAHVWVVEQRVYNHKTDMFDIWKLCADQYGEFKMFKTRASARHAIDHFLYGFAPKRVMKYVREEI